MADKPHRFLHRGLLLAATLLPAALWLQGCAAQTAADTDRPASDEVLNTSPPGPATAQHTVYILLTRSYEPEPDAGMFYDSDDIADLNSHVIRYARAAIEKARQTGSPDARVVFLIRSRPGWPNAQAAEFSLAALQRVAAASPQEARRLLRNTRWVTQRVPADVQPQAAP